MGLGDEEWVMATLTLPRDWVIGNVKSIGVGWG